MKRETHHSCSYTIRGILLREKKRKELLTHATQWMHLEKIILSEIRQIKRVHSICFHLYETLEDRNLSCGDKKANQWLPGTASGRRLDRKERRGTLGSWKYSCRDRGGAYARGCIYQNSLSSTRSKQAYKFYLNKAAERPCTRLLWTTLSLGLNNTFKLIIFKSNPNLE